MKKVVFGGVLVVLLATTALFGQGTQINALTQMKPNVVLTAVVTITPTQLKAMGTDGSNAVTLVSYDGTHVIVPITLTATLIPGTTPYDVGDITLNAFPLGFNSDSFLSDLQPSDLGMAGLTAKSGSPHPVSAYAPVTELHHDLVFGGSSGTTPLTLGDSSLQVTVAYMLI